MWKTCAHADAHANCHSKITVVAYFDTHPNAEAPPPPNCFCDRNLNHRLVFGRQLRKSISPLLFSLSMSDFIPSTAYSSPELVDPGLFPLPFVLTYSPNELPNLVVSPHSPPRRIMMLPKMSGSNVAVCGQVKDPAFLPSSLRLASFSGGWLG